MKQIKKVIISIILIFIFSSSSFAMSSDIEYRALIIGNDDYKASNASKLTGAVNDAFRIESLFQKLNLNDKKVDVKTILNRSGSSMIHEIDKTFENNKEKDISYIYYSGHGTLLDNEFAIIGVDMAGITARDIKKHLDDKKGKFIIIIDACNSGGFIDEFKKDAHKDNGKYKIITSARKDELAREDNEGSENKMGGVFTRFFIEAIGNKDLLPGDLNKNGELTMNEIYRYTKDRVYSSTVQVYPKRDSFIFLEKEVEKFNFDDIEDKEDWNKEFELLDKNKFLEIEFDEQIDKNTIDKNIFFVDNHNKKSILSDYKISEDGYSIEIYDLAELQKGREYNLLIGKDLKSKEKNHDKNIIIKIKVK